MTSDTHFTNLPIFREFSRLHSPAISAGCHANPAVSGLTFSLPEVVNSAEEKIMRQREKIMQQSFDATVHPHAAPGLWSAAMMHPAFNRGRAAAEV